MPLFAVVHWLIDNWFYLWHGPGDIQLQKPGFEERHNLAYVGNGFLLPKLIFAPSSERIHVVTNRWDPDHSSIAFVEDVDTYVEVGELREEFERLIDLVLKRLSRVNDKQEAHRLSEAWSTASELDSEEWEFSRTAAMCGIDPFDVEDSVSEAITDFLDGNRPLHT